MELYQIILIYIVMFIIVGCIQIITIEIIKIVNNIYIKYKFHKISIILSALIILFINFNFCCLILAGIMRYYNILPDFHDCFRYTVDSFSTLGTSDELPRPWSLLSPMIAIIGIICIAFASSACYSIVSSNIQSGNIFNIAV